MSLPYPGVCVATPLGPRQNSPCRRPGRPRNGQGSHRTLTTRPLAPHRPIPSHPPIPPARISKRGQTRDFAAPHSRGGKAEEAGERRGGRRKRFEGLRSLLPQPLLGLKAERGEKTQKAAKRPRKARLGDKRESERERERRSIGGVRRLERGTRAAEGGRGERRRGGADAGGKGWLS